MLNLFTDGLKTFLSPSSFSNVKPVRVSILTMIVYVALVTIISLLVYNLLFRPIPEERMFIILLIAELWTIAVIKVVALMLRLRFLSHYRAPRCSVEYSLMAKAQWNLYNGDNVAQVLLMAATVPALAWPFLVGITTLLWDALDIAAVIIPILFTIYTLYVQNIGFRDFVKLDKDLALLGTLFYVALNLAIGVIINGISFIMYNPY